jgi:putative copper resistance protein D
MISPETAFVATRFLFDLPAVFLWGGAIYLRLLAPTNLREHVWTKLQSLRALSTASTAVATFAALPLRMAMLGDGWADALNVRTMVDVLTGTSVGTAWIWQAAGTTALVCVSTIPSSRRRMAATAAASAFLLVGLALIGHATMDSGLLRVAHQAIDALHVLAGGAWLGALVPVMLILPLMSHERFGAEARSALIRFSTAGHFAVATVVLTGIANMLLIVGGIPSEWSLPYQILLTVKIGLVAVMVILAIVNRYWFVPRLSRLTSALCGLKIGTVAEIALGVGVVGLVAWFGMLEPLPG